MNRHPPFDDGTPVLDALTVALLDDAIGREFCDTIGADVDTDAVAGTGSDTAPVDVHSIQRVKRALLRRVAADNTPRHLSVPAAAGDWRPFGHGLQMKVLHEAAGVMSYLVRMQPGARLPAHRHPIDEECVVLEGEVCIGTLRIGAGGFHLGRQDVLHDQLWSDGGALIYLRGAVPDRALIL